MYENKITMKYRQKHNIYFVLKYKSTLFKTNLDNLFLTDLHAFK